ncbi:MAG TPA: 2-oxo acid dehydrogenase subunit E2 [Thermodesulfobacteriota bacterium]|nr:2-oxo acid dehydrogenase subunit E2 [Thermodesulfobacteriota bacterium]
MAIEFKLPDLGEDIETGDVTTVYVSAGDKVSKDQALMELETDKAALEIPSPADGVIKEVHVKSGETIKVGQLLVTIDDGAGGGEAEKKEAPKEKKAVPEKAEAKEEGEEGKEEPAKEEKAEEEPAPEEGKKEEAPEKPEGKAEEPEEGGKKEAGAKEPPSEKEAPPKEEKKPEAKAGPKAEEKETEKETRPAPESTGPSGIIPASPTVRRLAREMGVDIAKIKGTGPGGRITEEDLERGEEKKPAAEVKLRAPEAAEEKPAAGEAESGSDKWGPVESVPMSKVRRLTAERLTDAWKAPHVTQHDKADITEMEKLRKQYGKEVAEAGGKLTMTSIILKIAASALKAFPQFNASVDMENNRIVYKKYYNIGVAVDTDRGLLVPVIRDADRKNIEELSVDLSVLSEKARTKKITAAELQGGTFTVSNLGGIGGTYFTPVLNAPEVAILGVSRAVTEAVYIDGQFQPRLMLPLSLSYDHRLIDGADAARFARWIAEALEEPFRLSLEG